MNIYIRPVQWQKKSKQTLRPEKDHCVRFESVCFVTTSRTMRNAALLRSLRLSVFRFNRVSSISAWSSFLSNCIQHLR